MEFVAAKCPNCAGELRLPEDKKQVKCMYCGFDILVREAINAVGISVENLLKLAIAAEKGDNPQEAYEYFTKILEYEPENYLALLGKAMAAGRLSKSEFRQSELIEGAKSAVNHAPDNKKDELKISIAETIDSICSDFRIFSIKGDDEDSVFQRMRIVECLEFAHNYDPNNENLITSLYFENRQLGLHMKLWNLRYQTHTWEKSVDEHFRKAKEYSAKLSLINPEKGANLVKSEEEIEVEGSASTMANGSDWGTIVGGIIGVALVIAVFACCFAGR